MTDIASSDVSAGDDATATQYNNLQDDLELLAGECVVAFPIAYRSIGQGTWAWNNGAYYFYGFWQNSSVTDGDNFTINVPLRAGTYTLDLYCYKGSAFGIVDVYVDAVEIASFDTYDAGGTGAVMTDAGNVISATGLKAVKLQIDGKNGASSGYACSISAIVFRRTA